MRNCVLTLLYRRYTRSRTVRQKYVTCSYANLEKLFCVTQCIPEYLWHRIHTPTTKKIYATKWNRVDFKRYCMKHSRIVVSCQEKVNIDYLNNTDYKSRLLYGKNTITKVMGSFKKLLWYSCSYEFFQNKRPKITSLLVGVETVYLAAYFETIQILFTCSKLTSFTICFFYYSIYFRFSYLSGKGLENTICYSHLNSNAWFKNMGKHEWR